MNFVEVISRIAEARVKGTMIPVAIYVFTAVVAFGFVGGLWSYPLIQLLAAAAVVTVLALAADWVNGNILGETESDIKLIVRQLGLTVTFHALALLLFALKSESLFSYACVFDIITALVWVPGVVISTYIQNH